MTLIVLLPFYSELTITCDFNGNLLVNLRTNENQRSKDEDQDIG